MSITIDATNQPLGRLASTIAILLRGKQRPDFSPNKGNSEKVFVSNIEKVKLSGEKSTQKEYISHSGYIGHLKILRFPQVGPEKALRQAVAGMLPKNRLRKHLMKNLVIQSTDS